jgi:hypothetical protein
MSKTRQPNASEQELDKVEQQFKQFDEEVKQMTMDRMNATPKPDVEPQTQLSQKDIEKSKEIYLKPIKQIGSAEKFNEKWREDYNFAKEYVRFIAENREIIGEDIEIWSKPFPGVPAEMWKVPVNKPIWGPRYLAEQIKKCCYHRLTMENKIIENTGVGSMYGQMAIDTTIQRLDALPVSTRKSVFMGANF